METGISDYQEVPTIIFHYDVVNDSGHCLCANKNNPREYH